MLLIVLVCNRMRFSVLSLWHFCFPQQWWWTKYNLGSLVLELWFRRLLVRHLGQILKRCFHLHIRLCSDSRHGGRVLVFLIVFLALVSLTVTALCLVFTLFSSSRFHSHHLSAVTEWVMWKHESAQVLCFFVPLFIYRMYSSSTTPPPSHVSHLFFSPSSPALHLISFLPRLLFRSSLIFRGWAAMKRRITERHSPWPRVWCVKGILLHHFIVFRNQIPCSVKA